MASGASSMIEYRDGPFTVPDLVPVRMINEFAYCPRLAYLEWVQGEFADSADTVQGRVRHRRVDRERGGEGEEREATDEGEIIHARSLLLSSVVISVINNEEVKPNEFTRRAGGVALTDAARKRVVGAYERRMVTKIRHPLFGYTISYRQVLHVQARLLARTIIGELPRYPVFTTR